VTAQRFTAQLAFDGTMCAIPVPFDPRAVFGKARAPVVVDIAGHRYRSTISSMGGYWVPLRRSNREAAGLRGDERVEVTLTLDDAPRTVTPPAELARALPEPRPDVFVFGHTHVALVETVGGVLFLNPGAAGRPRFGGGVSVALLEIVDGRAAARIVPL